MELTSSDKNFFYTIPVDTEYKYKSNIENIIGQNVHRIFGSLIEKNFSVLDVGCGQGNYDFLKEEKQCSLFGIDIDPNAIEIVKKENVYKKAIVADLNNDRESGVLDNFMHIIGAVDVVIFADVLEHLPNPTDILLYFTKYLKKDGFFLISVPNISHIDILLNLINDKFNYTPCGILDNTHLKFFTVSSFAQWIQQINDDFDIKFECDLLTKTFYDSNMTIKFRNQYPRLYSILCDGEERNVLQLLFKLTIVSKESEIHHLEKLVCNNKKTTDMLGKLLEENCEKIIIKSPKILETEKLYIDDLLINYNKEIELGKYNHLILKTEYDQQKQYIEELESNVKLLDSEGCKQKQYIEELESNAKLLDSEGCKQKQYIEELENNVKLLDSEGCKQKQYIEELENNAKLLDSEGCKQKQYIEELENNAKLLDSEGYKQKQYIEELENNVKILNNESIPKMIYRRIKKYKN